MERLIEILDHEMERIDKIVKEFGRYDNHTKEEYQYTLGIMAGMFLSRGIDEATYNKYGKIIEGIKTQTN